METKKDRIMRLADYFANGKQARLSAMLGGSSMLIAGWLKRDYIDVTRVLHTFPEINPHWLRTGEGEMILPAAKAGIVQTIGDNNAQAYNIADGANVEVVRQLLGHSTLTMTQKYLRAIDAQKRAAQENWTEKFAAF